MVLESTKLERLRVIRDATFVDRFERADAEITLTPAVSEGVTGGATPSFSISLTPGVDDSTTEQRTGQFIDDFEDADVSEYFGDTGDVRVQGNIVDDGTYALAVPTGSTGSTVDTLIYSTSGLDIYPAPGDRFEVSLYVTAFEADPVFAFGLDDPQNFYYVRLGAAEDDLELGKLDGDVETEFDRVDVTIPEDEWLTIDISWFDDGTIDVDLKDSGGSILASVSTTDTTFDAGGIGFAQAQDFEN